MIDIEIDGKALKAAQGSMIIEVADDNGIPIPRFCYHKKLSVAANCRMCLVEVEKVGKPLPACATPVTPNMKVFTHSAKAKDAQRAVMEFLLINHPLDCPICDQGGQCELQDNSLSYGRDDSLYTEGKRVVADKNLGPLVATDLTRCIQCTRCVRFGQEIAGLRELGAVGRGEATEIRTFIGQTLQSEISANIIDLCPVGALTAKPSRFTARPWELTQHASISPHDCLGTNTYIHSRNGDVMRVVPRENDHINEAWLADRDRYSYTALQSPDRLHSPEIKIDGQWQTLNWTSALEKAAQAIQAESVAMLAAATSTTEELYLLHQIAKHHHIHRVDYQTKTLDQRDQALHQDRIACSIRIRDVEQLDTAVLIGANLHHEVPLLATRLRKATLQGCRIHAINPTAFNYQFAIEQQLCVGPDRLVDTCAGVLKAVLDLQHLAYPAELPWLREQTVSDAQQNIAQDLVQTDRPRKAIILGQLGHHHRDASVLRSLSLLLCQHSQAQFFFVQDSANTMGGRIAAHVSQHEFEPQALWHDQAAASYVLLNTEVELDCAYDHLPQLAKAKHVVAITTFASKALREQATLLLPAAAFAETSGSYVNVEGQWQDFAASVAAPFECKPAWKILRVLGNVLSIPGFDYTSCEDIRIEVQQALADRPLHSDFPSIETLYQSLAAHQPKVQVHDHLAVYSDWPIYRVDASVRRSQPLQDTGIQPILALHINQATAQHYGLGANISLGHCLVPVVIDERFTDNSAFVPAGYAFSQAVLAYASNLKLLSVNLP